MTPTEAVKFVELLKSASPATHFEYATPKAWAALLLGVDWADAEAGLRRAVTRSPFTSPAQVLQEIHAIRAERLKSYVPPAPADPDDWRGYIRQLRNGAAAAAAPPGSARPALAAGLDDTTRARGRQLRANGGGRMVDPAAPPAADWRSPAVRAAVQEARAACASASARRSPAQDPLTPAEQAARERAARERSTTGHRTDGPRPVSAADLHRATRPPQQETGP